MKAFSIAGIDEASVKVGDRMTWQSKDWGMTNDVIAEVQRDDAGAIIGIGFGSWTKVFTNRMKLTVKEYNADWPEFYSDPTAQIGTWWMLMKREGKL